MSVVFAAITCNNEALSYQRLEFGKARPMLVVVRHLYHTQLAKLCVDKIIDLKSDMYVPGIYLFMYVSS